MPFEVFYSHAREDEELRDELDKHLSILRREGLIVGWSSKREKRLLEKRSKRVA